MSLREDHPTHHRLKDARDGDIQLVANQPGPPSTTTIVPSSRYPTPLADSLPSVSTLMRSSSPGSNAV